MFTLPYLRWGHQRSLRCVNLPSSSSFPPSPDHGERRNLSIDPICDGKPPKVSNLGNGGGDDAAAVAEAARPWNLRTRRAACNEPTRITHGHGDSEKKEKVKFSVSLLRGEIEEDFTSLFGKKRPRLVQNQINTLFPGLWLAEQVTEGSYVVPEPTLTGGVLLLRNKYYIVIYRGKDFLPSSVAATLAERQELTKEIQDVEEKVRNRDIEATQPAGDKVPAEAGTLAEFYEAQARWGKEITPDHREKMIEEASRVASARVVKRIQHKLNLAQSKFQRAEKLLSKVEASMIPSGPDYDQEVISEEERIMFRKVGLKMKSYLPLGIRGVFDGVIENMHLHWKHRELVKLISKQKSLAFVEDTARLLEYESGGVLVAIEKVPKGFALIYYRGKNYQRPISLRPRNLLTKAKALKRSIAMQRHEALSQHISELEKTIEQMQNELTAKNPSYNESEWENDDDDDDDEDGGEEEKDDAEDDESDWDEADGESTISSLEEADYPLR
ncbi:hypothetical protein F2Q68_00003124 [Brassica cretica]|uniref:CRM domain-containing protein n=1 Tax=Brassica cretica TaxID=69181 RepID=A0A8S9JL41_BRACR|nr:hypothetical protein F2Q68_00003124 [Brassica cretica]